VSKEVPRYRSSLPDGNLQISCPNCRGGNPPEARSCMWCGAGMPSTQTAEQYCPSCRGGNPAVARNCMWCGASLMAGSNTELYAPSGTRDLQSGQATTQLAPYSQSAYAQRPQPYQQAYPYPPQPPITVHATQTVVVVGNRKSVGLAVLLAMLFGPFGMLYSTVVGAIVMFLVMTVLIVATLGTGGCLGLIACMVWAGVAADNTNKQVITQAQHVTRYP
jgi:hypothetical protein